MKVIAFIVIGGFILYLIIALAVKQAVKEALYEFKQDIIKELKNSTKDTPAGTKSEEPTPRIKTSEFDELR